MLRHASKLVAMSIALAAQAPALATLVQLEDYPTNWRLEDTVGSGVAVYYTGSPCDYGMIRFSSTATTEEMNRFFSLILSSKITNRKVGIFYDPDGCYIFSFYAP